MKKLFHPAFFLLLVQCFVPFLYADPDFTLSGIVKDATGARIPHAHIAARLTGDAKAIETDADEQGEFTLAAPAAGNYRIVVTAEGFQPLTAQAVVSGQSPAVHLDLTLQIAANAQTVEVTADALAAETTSTQMGETCMVSSPSTSMPRLAPERRRKSCASLPSCG